MSKLKLAFFCLLFITINGVSFSAFCSTIITYDKVDDGVIIHLDNTSRYGTKLLKIQVVADNIFRVLASPADSFSTQKSLMVSGLSKTTVKWQLKEKVGQLIISTSQINAVVFTVNGTIIFTDKAGNRILAEKQDGKIFEAIVADGDPLYAVKQAFESTASEGFYGLGQHQNGIMNYKGRPVDLTQNNTEVAIPFLVSSKNYGILWDNYSITKVMDSREFEPMSSLKLFAADGTQGWLTATYSSKNDNSLPATIRPESSVNYEYLDAMKNFPEGFKPGDGVVTWEGYIQSSFKRNAYFFIKICRLYQNVDRR